MEVNGAPGGGGHAPRSKRPALPNHSWRSQLEGEGQGLRASQQGVLWPLNAGPFESLTHSSLGTTFASRELVGSGERGGEGRSPEIQTSLCVGG